ncbi:MAG: hypothetical protein AAGA48_40105 [Myxococcota bacterium]
MAGWTLGLSLACAGPEWGWQDVPPVPAAEATLAPNDPFVVPGPLGPDGLGRDPLAPERTTRDIRGPTLLQRAATRVRNAYVLKLAPGTPDGARAPWARTVSRIGELGAASPFRVEDAAVARRLELGGWRTFRSGRPYEDVVSRLEQHSEVAWVESVVRLAGTRAAAERNIPGVVTIRALAGPDDPVERSITSLVLAERLIAAVDAGADVVWLPWVGIEHTEVVAEACAYARELGVTVVAPAGDQGFRNFVAYPAALDTTVAVGAEPEASGEPFKGNQGPGLDLVVAAPDSLIASAKAAGWMARLPTLDDTFAGPPPLTLLPRLHQRRLVASAFDLGPVGWDTATGFGRLDLDAAAQWPVTERDPTLIVAHRVERRSGHRAVVSWMTAEPASTLVKWEDGSIERATPTLGHRVVVRGTPGEVRRFALVSASPDRRDRRRVIIQF